MRKIINPLFFNKSALEVAKELLGKFLVLKKENGEEIALLINETEAYEGFEDKASHASKGKTERNKIMFEKGGCFYVYLVYGMYFMLNIVAGPENYPAAVLIRGAGKFCGPGKLTKFLNINKNLNGEKAQRKSGLWIEDRGLIIPEKNIKTTPRIGVKYAGPVWANKKYRFILKD